MFRRTLYCPFKLADTIVRPSLEAYMGAKPKMNRELVEALADHDHPTPWEVEFDLAAKGWHVNDAEGDRVGTFYNQNNAHAICDIVLDI